MPKWIKGPGTGATVATGSGTSGRELEWLHDTGATANAAPPGTLAAAPVRVTNHSGILIRLFIPRDTAYHRAGCRLVRQVQT